MVYGSPCLTTCGENHPAELGDSPLSDVICNPFLHGEYQRSGNTLNERSMSEELCYLALQVQIYEDRSAFPSLFMQFTSV